MFGEESPHCLYISRAKRDRGATGPLLRGRCVSREGVFCAGVGGDFRITRVDLRREKRNNGRAAGLNFGLRSNMNEGAHHSELGRIVVVATTVLLLISCWWTLQAFIPEPYFLRTPYQLRVMSTPNGLGQIGRSLFSFYATAISEAVALGSVAIFGWFSRTAMPAFCYLLGIISMAAITLERVAGAFRGLH